MIKIVPVESSGNVQIVADLARKIWTEHYVPIVGQEQIDYMLDTFQSPASIQNQIDNDGYLYFLLTLGRVPVGYLALQPHKSDIFLSKIYVDKSTRGSGVGTAAINFAKEQCLEQKLDKLWLTVNKHNTDSIAFYKHVGFTVTADIVQDIGNGFVMDDYRMELDLKN